MGRSVNCFLKIGLSLKTLLINWLKESEGLVVWIFGKRHFKQRKMWMLRPWSKTMPNISEKLKKKLKDNGG